MNAATRHLIQADPIFATLIRRVGRYALGHRADAHDGSPGLTGVLEAGGDEGGRRHRAQGVVEDQVLLGVDQ